jgi:fructokinase
MLTCPVCLSASGSALQEAEWLYGIPAADALAHPERVLAQCSGWRGVLVSGALGASGGGNNGGGVA